MHTYRFTGTQPHDFLYLPADPPARRLQPGDTVDCFEPVDHAHLELVERKAKSAAARKPKSASRKPKPAPAAETASASSKTEA